MSELDDHSPASPEAPVSAWAVQRPDERDTTADRDFSRDFRNA